MHTSAPSSPVDEPRHTSRGIVIHNNQLLLIERWRPGKHYFSVPGGGIEPGETAEQTVIREINEETGCEITLDRQLYLYHGPNGSDHHIFLCDYISGVPVLPPDSPEALEHNPDNRFEPRWLPLNELETAPFLVWRPVANQLIHDLANGFSTEMLELPSKDMVR